VLDKVQDSLATIYTAKTGKSLDEVNALVDAETWMTADEAVAAGFADAVGEDDDQEDETPKMVTDSVIWRGVKFPSAAMPQEIMLMAKDNTPPTVVAAPAPAPVLAAVPAAAGARAALARRNRAPRARVDQGARRGRSHRRRRRRARAPQGDRRPRPEGLRGHRRGRQVWRQADERPSSAWPSSRPASRPAPTSSQMRRIESAPIAAIATGTPDQGAGATEEQRAIKFMAERINARRGGSK
jgi:hypothetical protein